MAPPDNSDSPASVPISRAAHEAHASPIHGLSSEGYFRRFLDIEMKRTERSNRPFLLVTIDISEVLRSLGAPLPGLRRRAFMRKFARVLDRSTRASDARGWLVNHRIAGIICVEASESSAATVTTKLKERMTEEFGPEMTDRMKIESYVYPAFVNKDGTPPPVPPHVHDWIIKSTVRKQIQHAAKRVVDIAGALTAIAIFSPVLVIIPILIKLTSPGPALFRQERVGRGGRKFRFYKFRSMHLNNDDGIHREFVSNLIKGKSQKASDGREIFKIERDPRITPIGRIIRKASIDELPQLFNVLKGDMSLVGPRPAIPYEVEQYEPWHLARIVGVKPGITGLWQVEGRSRTTFEAMTRMDIRYARAWSVWWDLVLLVKTPFSVLAAKGAR